MRKYYLILSALLCILFIFTTCQNIDSTMGTEQSIAQDTAAVAPDSSGYSTQTEETSIQDISILEFTKLIAGKYGSFGITKNGGVYA